MPAEQLLPDDSPDDLFDDLARLASLASGAPIVLIAYPVHGRLWCWSKLGWNIDQLAIEDCFWVASPAGQELCVVADALAQPELASQKYVAGEPHFRSFATATLRTAAGTGLFSIVQSAETIGWLTVLDVRPRSFSADQLEALRTIAAQVVARLEQRRGLRELRRKHSETEIALRDSELFYHSLVETLPHNIIRKDRQGRFTFANSRFCETVCRAASEIIGKTDFDLFPPDLAAKYQADDRRVIEEAKGFQGVEKHQDQNGETLYVQVIKSPLFDAAGEVCGVQGIFWDETVRHKAEEALAYERDLLRAMLENIPDSIYFKDRQARFFAMSRSFAARLGLKEPREAFGKTDRDFFSPELAQSAWEDERRILRTGEPLVGKVEKDVWPDGIERWSMITKVPLRNRQGEITGTFGITTDITELKQVESALAQARDTAIEAARQKSEFLANMSHEIRTPLNAVIGMTGLLLETSLTSEQEELTVTVRNSADGLLGIINDILDCSKMEAGKLAIEMIDFDLGEVIEGVTDLLGERAHSKKLELIAWIDDELPRGLRGDPGRIRQILTNLAANAVKFTTTGEVILEVKAGPRQGHTVEVQFRVTDSGIGISPEARQRIFQAFVQADGSTTRRFGGTGLGLAISKQLTELMRGEIGCDSEPGRGSTFWFKLPLEIQAAQKPRPDCAMFEGCRVLVADANAASRDRLCRRLQAWRMRPSGSGAATTVLQALEKASQQDDPFQLVLADQGLAEIGGVDLAREINAQSWPVKPVVVLLTGVGQLPAEPVLRESGVFSHLVKPLKESRLYESLVSVIRGTAASGVRTREAAPPASAPGPDRPLRLLLAEDNPINQKVALRQLQKLGYSVDAVANGLEALKAQRAIKYDVILMDCQMPEMDGFEATRRIRVEENELHLPPVHIIAMTANALAGDRELCLAAGMDDYLSKPVRVEALSAALRRGVEKTTMERVQESKEPLLNPETVQGLRELRMPGEPDPISELVDLFLADAPGLVSRIRAAFTARDGHELERVCHTLKGSASNLGADRLAQACFRVMSLAREGQAAAEPDIRHIESEFDIVRPELEKLKLESEAPVS